MIETVDNFDTTKLVYHPKRVLDWLNGERVYPIYGEISLTSACNHRCKFCGPRFYLNYKSVYIDTNTIKATIKDMSETGVKAIMFGGEGEPLLHKNCVEIIKYTKECGIDVGLTTNGILFKGKILDELLPILSWVKFSVDSGDYKIYASLHGTKELDFKILLDNISKSSFIKRLRKYDVLIEVQSILFEDNIESLPSLAKLLKEFKVDYFIVKPYSKHIKSYDDSLKHPTEEQVGVLLKEMEKYKRYFKFIYRTNAFSTVDEKKPYDKCYGQDFIFYLDTLGNIYSCINYIGDDNFCYGNIYKRKFNEIWLNKKEITPNITDCRTICRLDLCNRYLYNLKNKPKHINFI